MEGPGSSDWASRHRAAAVGDYSPRTSAAVRAATHCCGWLSGAPADWASRWASSPRCDCDSSATSRCSPDGAVGAASIAAAAAAVAGDGLSGGAGGDDSGASARPGGDAASPRACAASSGRTRRRNSWTAADPTPRNEHRVTWCPRWLIEPAFGSSARSSRRPRRRPSARRRRGRCPSGRTASSRRGRRHCDLAHHPLSSLC